MILPSSRVNLTNRALDVIGQCRESVGQRAAQARALRTWRYTGSPDGVAAIANRLDGHIERVSSYLFSPSDLRFDMEFVHSYGKQILDQAEVAARVLTREWQRRDIDIQFGEGVDTALTFGACIPKLVYGKSGVSCKLVMPWQMGVMDESKSSFGDQEAIVETNYITPYDLWRRISHLPNATELYRRARAYGKRRGNGDDANASYLHQVLIAGTNPSVQTAAPYTSQAGGIVDLSSNASDALLAPQVFEDMILMHELWVLDDEREDYTTIQIVEPDILISPQYVRRNLFVPEYLPYGMIQPNRQTGYFWGRPEIVDLMKLQQLLRDRLEDIKKLMGLQYDRFLAITGGDGMTDEMYDQSRQAGYMNLGPGADVKDLTPPLPKEAFADIQEIMSLMDEVSGFQNILSGQGEPGVRAGNHAATLMKTASPRLRDRAILVERQCADLGDKTLQCLSAKEAKAFWVGDEHQEGNEFLLSGLPEDAQITVDSHSSSPIYEDDHKDLAAFLQKAGIADAADLVDMLPIPRRDRLKQHIRDREAAKAKLVQEHPELLTGGKKPKH